MELKIKDEFLNTVVGFNNSSLPLGQRKDLHVLFDLANKSNNKRLLNYFEEIPSQKEFEKIKEDQILEDTKPEGYELTKEADSKTPPKKQRKANSNTDSQ
ncbi:MULTISPECIES: hypothetical protein [Chryseobacterium]|uniref:Uncharacterized protein n=1 Tax=Chryseobacterium gambrini TaxID=373672 RepID=A0A1N7LDT1_9FLAO|nr:MULTISPECIES: hypothetical protein [Chryseobacterium]SIS72012.1 hypothetical protein SAMN05421785_102169 [Chryseobacterium gambrini]